MIFLLIAIVLLLAAILITLLTAWNTVAMVVLGLIVWILLITGLSSLFGDIGAKIGIIGPFVLLIALAIYGGIAEAQDKSKRLPPVRKLTAAERQAEMSRLRQETRDEEERRRADLAALRKDIEDRSR